MNCNGCERKGLRETVTDFSWSSQSLYQISNPQEPPKYKIIRNKTDGLQHIVKALRCTGNRNETFLSVSTADMQE
jgi:hypothetical protein